MEVIVGVSNRHVHLNEEDYKLLFGETELEKKVDLKQPGTFASTQTVTLVGPKREIPNVRVLGPNRSYTQVEVSKTDCYTLGTDGPIRNSGDLEGASNIKIVGPCGEIERNALIIATRHIHVDKDIRKEYGLENIDNVKVKVNTEKPTILENVYIKETEKAFFEIHLDTDDANSCLLKQNDYVEIIKE